MICLFSDVDLLCCGLSFYFIVCVCYVFFFFFFFQAEDGIRDHCVTGVQTCALPIWGGFLLGTDATIPPARGLFLEHTYRMHPDVCRFVSEVVYDSRLESAPDCANQRIEIEIKRSEERRVGKECTTQLSSSL